jgi:predicted RNA-binding protein YlxR (DUF448 family)
MKSSKRRQPQRSCIACRQRFDKRALSRLVFTGDAGVVVDATGKRNGRGAYLCSAPGCWQKILQHPDILAAALKTELRAADLAPIAAAAPQDKIAVEMPGN